MRSIPKILLTHVIPLQIKKIKKHQINNIVRIVIIQEKRGKHIKSK